MTTPRTVTVWPLSGDWKVAPSAESGTEPWTAPIVTMPDTVTVSEHMAVCGGASLFAACS